MKKLLAIAVAAALTAPAAMADTTLYGKLHESVGSVKTTDGNVSSTANQVSSNTSRVGIKGATALDNGMEAIYGLEWGVGLDGDAANLNTRNQFIGLKGKFGTVLAGKHDTPSKLATASLDTFADTAADMGTIIGSDNERVNNAVAYINKFGPVGFAVAHSTNPLANDAVAPGVLNTTRNANTMMLNYSNGPWYAAVGGTNVQNLGKTTNVGLGWKSDAGHNVGLVYETAKGKTTAPAGGDPAGIGIPGTDGAGNAMKDKNIYLGGGYKIGNVTLKAAYGTSKRTGDSTNVQNGKEKLTAVGVDYSLGKKTSVYLMHSDDKNMQHLTTDAVVADGNNDRIKSTQIGLVTEF
jgi:predicted porin